MDLIAKTGYKFIKSAVGKDNIINTADAFLINQNDEWFLIEFKDDEVKADNSQLKNSVLKDYLFKDAYVYTERFFERKFVNRYVY